MLPQFSSQIKRNTATIFVAKQTHDLIWYEQVETNCQTPGPVPAIKAPGPVPVIKTGSGEFLII